MTGTAIRRWAPPVLLLGLLVAGGVLRWTSLETAGLGLAEWERVEPALGTPGAPPLLSPHPDLPLWRLLVRGAVWVDSGGSGAGAHDRAVRLPGFVLGLLAVPLLFLLGRRLSGGQILPGLVLAGVWSLCPLGVGAAREVAPEAGLALASAWLLHAALWLEEAPRRRGRQVNLALALLLGTALHPILAWLAVAVGAWLLLRTWTEAGRVRALWPWVTWALLALPGLVWWWLRVPSSPTSAAHRFASLARQFEHYDVGLWSGPLGLRGLQGWHRGEAFTAPLLASAAVLVVGALMVHLRRARQRGRTLSAWVVISTLGGAFLLALLAPRQRLGAGCWLGSAALYLVFPFVVLGAVEAAQLAVHALRDLIRQQQKRREALHAGPAGLVLVGVLALVVAGMVVAVSWPAAHAVVESTRRLQPGDPVGAPVEPYRELAQWIEGARRPDSVVLVHAGRKSREVTRLLRYYGLQSPVWTVTDPELEGWWADRGPVARLARKQSHAIVALARVHSKRMVRLMVGVRRRFAQPVGHVYLRGLQGPVFGAILEVGCTMPRQRPGARVRP